MLVCKEQQNPIVFEGRALQISHKALNAYYCLCNMPLTPLEVSVYLGTALKEDKACLEKYTNAQLASIVEAGIKDEFLSLATKEAWDVIWCQEDKTCFFGTKQ